MQSSTVKAREALLDALEGALGQGADGGQLSSDLFVLVGAIDSEPALRRILTEPSVPVEAKRTMLRSLLEGKVADSTLEVVDAGVGHRWSQVRDLPDSLEYAAITALAAKAAKENQLDGLEDDLFRFGRIVESEPELRNALEDAAAPVEAKRRLLESLLGDRTNDTTRALLDQVVVGRHRSVPPALQYYQKVVAERRDRLVATVWVAAPLSDDHRQRLARALAEAYSQDMHLNVIVDPQVLGGVRVAVGDELIDSTIETRLAQAERRLAR
jgi:F-type H+-transporting ATPase subunit delta